MIEILLALAAIAQQPAEAPAAQPVQGARLSIEAQAGLRCSAAFALVAYDQERGVASAQQWPAIDPRGREYFVRTMAKLMDETGIDREAAAELVRLEAQRLLDAGEVDAVMPACLTLLEASGIR